MTLFQSLSFRPFVLLWGGQTISRLGDALYRLALGWWVLEKTGSAAITSAVYILGFAPMLVFLLIGGVAADRLPKLRVMFWSDFARGVITAVLALLAMNNLLQVWHVLVASALFGLAEAFFAPAFVSSIPSITPTELLPSANSLESISRQLASIVGPTLGAIIVAGGGTTSAFAINSLTFFVGAVCALPILGIETFRPTNERTTPANAMRDLLDGLRLIMKSRWLWVTIAIAAFSNVAIGSVRTVGAMLFVQTNLQANVTALGLMTTAAAVGGVVAAMIIGSFKRLRHRGIAFYVIHAMAGIGLVSVSLQNTLPGTSPA